MRWSERTCAILRSRIRFETAQEQFGNTATEYARHMVFFHNWITSCAVFLWPYSYMAPKHVESILYMQEEVPLVRFLARLYWFISNV